MIEKYACHTIILISVFIVSFTLISPLLPAPPRRDFYAESLGDALRPYIGFYGLEPKYEVWIPEEPFMFFLVWPDHPIWFQIVFDRFGGYKVENMGFNVEGIEYFRRKLRDDDGRGEEETADARPL